MAQLITLYHGTDARMVAMTKDERDGYLAIVDRVTTKLWDFFKPYYNEYIPRKIVRHGEVIETYMRSIEQYKGFFDNLDKSYVYANLIQKLSMLDARDNGSGLFQYGSLYLAVTEHSAEKYAYSSFAGGESGLTAYRLIEAITLLQFPQWQPTPETQKGIHTIMQFASEEKSDPVIIRIDGIDRNNLLTEDGNDPTNYFEMLDQCDPRMDLKFRYKGNLDLTKYPMTHLKNNA